MRLALLLFPLFLISLPAYSIKVKRPIESQEIKIEDKIILQKKIKPRKKSNSFWKRVFAKIRLFRMNILGWILSLGLGGLLILSVIVDNQFSLLIEDLLVGILKLDLLFMGFCLLYALTIILIRIFWKKKGKQKAKKGKKKKGASFKKCYKF